MRMRPLSLVDFDSAVSGSNQPARSTSGKLPSRPDLGGHSISEAVALDDADVEVGPPQARRHQFAARRYAG